MRLSRYRCVRAAIRCGASLDRLLDRGFRRIEPAANLCGVLLIRLLCDIHRWTGEGLLRIARETHALVRRTPWPLRLAGLLAGAAFLLTSVAVAGSLWIEQALQPVQMRALRMFGLLPILHLLRTACLGLAGTAAVALPLCLVRRALVLRLVQGLATAFACLWAWVLFLAWRIPALLESLQLLTPGAREGLSLFAFAVWLPGAVLGAVLLLALWTASAGRAYGGVPRRGPLMGDRFWHSLRSGGPDPRFRSSAAWSIFGHVFLVIYPFLALRGCTLSAHLPRGEDGGGGHTVVIPPPPQKDDKPNILLHPNSPFRFDRPPVDESDVFDKVLKEAENIYTSQGIPGDGVPGNGRGRNGKAGTPGYRWGVDGPLAFLRLEYAGGDWDQDLYQHADDNMLRAFGRLTGKRVETCATHRPIADLARYRSGRAPPFVFLTGGGGMQLSRREAAILRRYCLEEGGLLFLDHGGGRFGETVRRLRQQVFPDKGWSDIANDDPLFGIPFAFPNGAPPLWHHGGRRALGIRHNGRWVAFYHPGDLNDAWKDGHSGLSAPMAERAYRLGTNVMEYACHTYAAVHAGRE